MERGLLCADRITNRSDGIDSLRGFLALWVVFVHTIPWTVAAQGATEATGLLLWVVKVARVIFQPAYETNPAVLAFIVLSGYCIHRSGLRPGRYDLSRYAASRAFRIYPVFVLATCVGVAGFLVALTLDSAMAPKLTGTNGIHWWIVAAKFVGLSALVPQLHYPSFQGNAPLVTVIAEMWLYAVYPIAIAALSRMRSERPFWLALLTIWFVGILCCRTSSVLAGWWHNGSLFGFLLYWWIGAAFVSRILSRRALVLAAGGWLVTSGALALGLNDLFVVELRKLCFVVLIGAAVSAIDRGHIKFRIVPPWIGAGGYSLYAFHAPVVYCLAIWGSPWWATIAVAMFLGLSAAYLFELPLTQAGKRAGMRVKPAEAAA